MVNPTTVRFDVLPGCSTPHPNNDRSRHQGIGKPAKAGQGDGAVRRNLLGLDYLASDNAPTGDGTAPMASIQQAAYLLVVLGLGAEDGVDLVEQDRHAVLAADLAEEIGRRDVHRLNWRWN